MSENIGNQEHREIVRSPFRADEEQPYIFISYSHKDRERVFPIIKRLYEQGWKIWYDEGLEIATNYLATLAQHIKNCAAFLLFVTENSVKSEFVCEKELIVASNYNKIIVQCVLDETAQFSGEAKDVIDLVTASRKHPKTDEAGLEAVLEVITGLGRGERREAKGIRIAASPVVTTGENDDYEFILIDDGVRLTRYLGSDENVHVPSEYPTESGLPVVELGGTFAHNKSVRKVWVSESVRRIESFTFTCCENLSDIYIPSSVKHISDQMFVRGVNAAIHCIVKSAAFEFARENDARFVLEETLRTTDEGAVSSDGGAYVYFSYSPDKIDVATEVMGKLAEAGCKICDGGRIKENKKLEMMRKSRCFAAFLSTEYVWSDYIEELLLASETGKELMMYILEACDIPGEIEIRHSVEQRLYYSTMTEEERHAKMVQWLEKNGCRKTTAIPDFEYTATKGGIRLTRYIGEGTHVIINREYDGIPVTVIDKGTFTCCEFLNSIIIPSSVVEIGARAFFRCNRLTSVTIPESVTIIGSGAFDECDNLEHIGVDENNKWFCSRNGVVLSKDNTVLVACPPKFESVYAIPDSVTTIGNDAFLNCKGLSNVTIPDSVVLISDYAFYGCSGLSSVNIPGAVTRIGKSAFSGCEMLTSITIPNSVTEIGDSAFYGCVGLSSIIIPDSVKEIGDSTFHFCEKLTVFCDKGSCAWAYCEENDIPHKELAEMPNPSAGSAHGPVTTEPCVEPALTEEPSSVHVPDPREEPAFALTPAKSPTRRSSAWWLIPAALALALGGAAAVQLTGLFDILGAIGSLLG